MPAKRSIALIVVIAIIVAIVAVLAVRARPTGGLTPVGFHAVPVALAES